MQRSPHNQTQQNVKPQQTDLEPNEAEYESGTDRESDIYENMNGAQTGENRSPRAVQTRSVRHNTEPETEAHEGPVHGRTSAASVQGVTSHSSDEERTRQEQVVRDRPDAQAGVSHSKK